jgi:hypothetical protein
VNDDIECESFRVKLVFVVLALFIGGLWGYAKGYMRGYSAHDREAASVQAARASWVYDVEKVDKPTPTPQSTTPFCNPLGFLPAPTIAVHHLQIGNIVLEDGGGYLKVTGGIQAPAYGVGCAPAPNSTTVDFANMNDDPRWRIAKSPPSGAFYVRPDGTPMVYSSGAWSKVVTCP